MQLSRILIGVNIAASISVALTGQAKANEGALGTAAFLKSSLNDTSSNKGMVAKANMLKAKKKTSPNPAAITKYSSPKSVSLRDQLGFGGKHKLNTPKLPTRKELALKRQQAQMASMQKSKPLSASVSTYAPFYLSSELQSSLKSAKAKRSFKRQTRKASRAVVNKAAKVASKLSAQPLPHRNPVMPGQVGHPCATHSLEVVSHAKPKAQEQQKLQPPHLSLAEREQLENMARVLFLKDKLHANHNNPGFHSPLDSKMSARQRVDKAYSRVGPPPFPLNLIPEPAMKDFLSRARNRKSMIRSYPGAFAGRPSSNLGHSGFQSYSRKLNGGSGFTSYAKSGGSGFTSYAKHANSFSQHYSQRAGHNRSFMHHSSHHHAPAKHHHASIHHSVHQQPVIHKAHAKVAKYGPYGSSMQFRGL